MFLLLLTSDKGEDGCDKYKEELGSIRNKNAWFRKETPQYGKICKKKSDCNCKRCTS
jgi:hypothetical protein